MNIKIYYTLKEVKILLRDIIESKLFVTKLNTANTTNLCREPNTFCHKAFLNFCLE